MRKVEYWLCEYAQDHRHPGNQRLHAVCVPLIVIAVIGLLASLPVPGAFYALSPALDWATVAIVAALLYYLALSLPLGLGMLPALAAAAAIAGAFTALPWPAWATSAGLFALGWAGQFYGHVLEGRRPAFLRDLRFLAIGPLWVLAGLYRRAGLRY